MALDRKCNYKHRNCRQHKDYKQSPRNLHKRYEVEKNESHCVDQQHHNHESSADSDYEFNGVPSISNSSPMCDQLNRSTDLSSSSLPYFVSFTENPSQCGKVTTKINGNNMCGTCTNKNKCMSIELLDSAITLDENHIDQSPEVVLTLSNLNDNIDKTFLNNMVIQFGKIKLIQIFYHPVSGKHLGLAKIIFENVASAKCCVQKLNKTSVMGKVVNVFLDSLATQCNIMYKKMTEEIPKRVPSTNQDQKSVKSGKFQEEHVKTQTEQNSHQSRVDDINIYNCDYTNLSLTNNSNLSSVYCYNSTCNSGFNRTHPNNRYPSNVLPVPNYWKNETSPVELSQVQPPSPYVDVEGQSKVDLVTGTKILLNEKQAYVKPMYLPIVNKGLDNAPDGEAQSKTNLVTSIETLLIEKGANIKPAFLSIVNKGLDNIPDIKAQSKVDLVARTEMLLNEKHAYVKPAFLSIVNKDFDNAPVSEDNMDIEVQSKVDLVTRTEILNEKQANIKPMCSSIVNKGLEADGEAQSKINLVTGNEMLLNEKHAYVKPTFLSIVNKALDDAPVSEENSIDLNLFASRVYDSQSDSYEENFSNEEELLLPLSNTPSSFLSKEIYNKCFKAAADQLKIWKEEEKLEAIKIFKDTILNNLIKKVAGMTICESLHSNTSLSDDESVTGESSESNNPNDTMSLSTKSSHSEKIFGNNSNIIPKPLDELQNTFLEEFKKKCMNSIVKELKRIIKRNLMEKIKCTIAFNALNQWWKKVERQSKNNDVENKMIFGKQKKIGRELFDSNSSISSSESPVYCFNEKKESNNSNEDSCDNFVYQNKSKKLCKSMVINNSNGVRELTSTKNKTPMAINISGSDEEESFMKYKINGKSMKRKIENTNFNILPIGSKKYCPSINKTQTIEEAITKCASPDKCITSQPKVFEHKTKLSITKLKQPLTVKDGKKLVIINQLTSQKHFDNQVKTEYFNKRDMIEEIHILYEFLNKGIDMEDINYLKESYESLRSSDAVHYYELLKTCWISHPDIPNEIPFKQINDEWKIHYTGCSRSEGYYKIDSIQKNKYKYHFGHSNAQLNCISELNQAKKSSNSLREARSNQRQLKCSRNTSSSDLSNFNRLMSYKKKIKFEKSSIHDWGLFAVEPIASGDVIVEYVGQIIRPTVADLREKRYEAIGIGSSYLFKIDVDTIIDATMFGNLSRFINHSCTPNCCAKITQIEGKKKIIIYSNQAIQKNEEITYDYKFPLEENKIPCWCGTHSCRGTLN